MCASIYMYVVARIIRENTAKFLKKNSKPFYILKLAKTITISEKI